MNEGEGQFNMRMNASFREKLKAIRDYWGISATGALKVLIQKEFERIQKNPKKPGKKT